MSTFAVEIAEIDAINPHPNADKLELATVKGWSCVVQKGTYKAKDLCIYIPIDSVLPDSLEKKIFGPESKVKLNKHRVKTIKLRGAISQGLVVPVDILGIYVDSGAVGEDVTGELGITKYEQPVAEQSGPARKATKKEVNPAFMKYTDLENVKNYMKVFEPGEMVSVTEKIHGTNFRAGYVPHYASGFWQKFKDRILRLVGKVPSHDFVYGSRNVQLQNNMVFNGAYSKTLGTNIYADIVKQYSLHVLLKPGEVVYGEIYGSGIQTNYEYGMNGFRALVVFDVMIDGKYLDADDMRNFCALKCLPYLPELYRGPYDYEKIKALTIGNSVLAPTQKVREGVVCKPIHESMAYCGRKVLKFISDEYLLRDDTTEFH